MTRLRIATFNIRNGRAWDGLDSWPLRRGRTAAALRALDADVVGLQEAYRCQETYLVGALDGYQAEGSGRGRRSGGERCPVMWRSARLSLASTTTRWFSDEPSAPGSRLSGATHPRIATIVTFEEMTIASVHLDQRVAANRMRSARMVVDWLADEASSIVVGDLNEGPDGLAVRLLEDAGYRSVLPRDAGGTNHDFTGRTDGARLDHILVSDAWRVVDAGVWTCDGPRYPSDHWPVWADVETAV